ncbi:MAG TPA: hypothetical protein VGG04_17680, partial [Candidatus Sulfotelmatobacter sp.]
MPDHDPITKKEPNNPKRAASFLPFLQIVVSLLILGVVVWQIRPLSRILQDSASGKRSTFVPAKEGTWRFIVSGDSRNCGD